MCIIYSSYIQHLTNKHKERETTEKSTVGSEAQRRWELFECKWVPMSAPHSESHRCSESEFGRFLREGGGFVASSRDWAATRFSCRIRSNRLRRKKTKPWICPAILLYFCSTVPGRTAPPPGPSPGFRPAVRPDVWSAQTWTLGTLFTHVVVTCKTSL